MPSDELQGLHLPAHFLQDFEPRRLLGKGGMGFVLLAREKKTKKSVACKFLLPQVIESESTRKRFQREARLAIGLKHKALVRGISFGDDKTSPYLVFEYVEAGNLAEYMATASISEKAALLLIKKIGAGLAYAHKNGVIHRDLKPHNILISRAGQPKITDFGLAAVKSEAERLTRTGILFGTPAYMAPEQIVGTTVDERADLYALATIAYELLAKVRPFNQEVLTELLTAKSKAKAPSLRKAKPRVSRTVASAIDRALSREPCQRQSSVEQFLKELEANVVVQSEVVETLVKKKKANRTLVPIVLFFALIVFSYFLLFRKSDKPIVVFKLEKRVAASEVTISWLTDRPCHSALLFKGGNLPEEGQLVSAPPTRPRTKIHRLSFSQLEPSTKYEVQIITGQKEPSLPNSFRTKNYDVLITPTCGVELIVLNLSTELPGIHSCQVTWGEGSQEGNFKRATFSELCTVFVDGLRGGRAYSLSVQITTATGRRENHSFTLQTKKLKSPTQLGCVHPKNQQENVFDFLSRYKYAYSAQKRWQGCLLMAIYDLGISCFDLKTEKTRWERHDSLVKSVASMVVWGDELYCLNRRTAKEQYLQCISCRDGKTKWRVPAPLQIVRTDFHVTKEGIFIMLDEKGPLCYDKENGDLLWKVEQGFKRPFGFSPNGRIWSVDEDNMLKAVSASSGNDIKMATKQLHGQLHRFCPPREIDQMLYLITTDGRLLIYPIYGRKLFREIKLGGKLRYPFVGNGIFIVGTAEELPEGGGKVFCFDTKRHELKWQYVSKQEKGFAKSFYHFDDRALYFFDEADYLVALHQKTGHKLWSHKILAHAPFDFHVLQDKIIYCRSAGFWLMSIYKP